MAFWDIDLTTRMGAESAADNGGLACYIKAGFMVLGAVFIGGMAGFDTVEGQVIVAAQMVQVVVFVIAGYRMKAGKGAFWGMAAAALLALTIIDTLVNQSYGGVLLNGLFLAIVIQGIRGSLALRKGLFADEDFEVFE